MTVVFQVNKPALVDKAKACDKLRFRAEPRLNPWSC